MMKNRPLGCFTFPAVFATFLTLILIAGSAYAAGGGFFSPGSLNASRGESLGGFASHSEIGRQCAKCHPAPWDADTMGDRCVKCHQDIALQLLDVKTIHGAIKGQQAVLNCRPCHPDHRGPDASLTIVVSADFPHAVTGFALTAHPKRSDGIAFSCSDCHIKSYKQFDKNLCADCHMERDKAFTTTHIDEFGADCLACHDGVDRYGKSFDHNQVAFKLDGKHNGLACAKCHQNARKADDLRNTTVDCKSCHLKDDAHKGRFGTTCGDCHNPAGWQENVKFDHSLANFKLIGKHASVECAKCHTVPHQFAGTATDCYSCHARDDQHKGTYGTNCADCHTPVTWKHDKLDHSLFAFKLDGTHTSVECLKCHQNGVFKGTPATCFGCHQKDDFHKGQYGQQCDLCHSTTAWKPSTFNHQTSAFPLTGAHTNLKCTACHKAGQFQSAPASCAGCHGEPVFHAGVFGVNCGNCHTTNNWNARYTGPHPSIGEGNGINHGGASCRDCHTVSVTKAVCTKCHNGNNNPGGGD
jgi:hypothetical protein